MESSSAAARPTNLSFSPTEESAAFPDIAIRWILKYSCTTNSNLAVISNINKHCRAVTCDVIEEMLKAAQNQNLSSSPITQITTKQLIQQKEEEEIKGNQKVVVTPSFSEYKHLSALLLPEMTLEILRQAKNNNNSRSSANTVTPNSMIPPSSLFCLAWFHPTGIQIQSIDTNAQSDDEDHNCLSSSSSSSSSSKHNGNEEFGGEYRHELWECRQKLQLNISRRAQVLNNSGVIRGLNTNYELAQNCSNEWRGYRNAMDVLLPLGYKTYFVQTVLNMASKLSLANNTLQAISSDERETTFAVRGATFARPQGYCLCWDADQAVSKLASQLSNLDMDNISHKNNDGDESKNQRNHIHHHNNQTQRNNYKLHDLRRRKRKHDKMRRIKMKASLPRIIFSTEVKNPIYQVSNQDSNKNYRRRRRHGVTTGDETGGVPSSAILPGKRQKCLQFLNVDGSRAVYLRTPPFECGPVQTPVTMFCVGIATEDGCFVSGLESRFELGHIHGVDPMDKEIDMSPICICAENISGDKSEGRNEVNCIRSYSEDISDSSNDDYQIKRKGSIVCQCKIQYRKSDDENDSKEESLCLEPYPGNIYRGQIGPGRWHCYTATFNGDNPIIRVDGCTEQVKNHSKQSRRPYGDIPVLNGLTIGSDHCFEMPLCCGEGSDGEGEGSIAELIVFRGAMQVEDIECYEKYLMEKHGIVHGQQQIFPLEESALVENVGNHWQEDLWRRQAHALMSHPPPYELGGGASVPLRVAAKHRMVAWHRSNDVTGKNVRVSRIGSKISTGSSDW